MPEGSSLSARQAIAALGPLGYRIGICDPNPLCLCRFSRFVSEFNRSPALGRDPLGYWRFLLSLVKQKKYDVLLPVHEHAFLFSRMRNTLSKYIHVAVAGFDSFQRAQSKAAFMKLLDELNLPHPSTKMLSTVSELGQMDDFPYYVKSEFGTAGTGVWLVKNTSDRTTVMARLDQLKLPSAESAVMVQKAAPGVLEVCQSVFDRGELLAWHCYQQRAQGVGGSASARIGVDRPVVAEHLRKIGTALNWHGSLMLDYIRNPENEEINYIEANPRMGETMNATLNGVNLADLLVRVSLNQKPGPVKRQNKPAVESHTLMGNILGIAHRRGSRGAILKELERAFFDADRYAKSEEEIARGEDAVSFLPLLAVSAELIFDPERSEKIARKAVSDYSLTPAAIKIISNLPDSENA